MPALHSLGSRAASVHLRKRGKSCLWGRGKKILLPGWGVDRGCWNMVLICVCKRLTYVPPPLIIDRDIVGREIAYYEEIHIVSGKGMNIVNTLHSE